MKTRIRNHIADAIEYYLSAADILRMNISEEEKTELNEIKDDLNHDVNLLITSPGIINNGLVTIINPSKGNSARF